MEKVVIVFKIIALGGAFASMIHRIVTAPKDTETGRMAKDINTLYLVLATMKV